MIHTHDAYLEITRQLRKPGTFAVVFFLVAVAVLTTAVGTAWLVMTLATGSPTSNQTAFIVSFAISTGLLATVSVKLVRASAFVKMERQPQFRRCLAWALAAGTAFISVQTYGLQALITQHSVDIAARLRHAAFAFILLHAIHVVVALLFVLFICLRTVTDHYDHEYSWGVTFCGWFWHVLGIVWIAIMAVFAVAGTAAMTH